MSAAITDKFTEATNGSRPIPTTLTALKAVAASSISCGALTGWPTATAVHFIIYTTDTQGLKVANSQTDWKGIVSGTTITNLSLKAGTDNGYAIGAIVECAPTAAWADDTIDGILVQHNQDGTHGAITATSLTATTATITTLTATTLITNNTDGFITATDTWTYASATTFTIAGVDRTARFPVGTKIALTQTTVKYFYVTAASFSTNTTITVTGGSDYTLANAAITSPTYSYAAAPQGFPQTFSLTPTWTNLTPGNATLNSIKFSMQGRQVIGTIFFVLGSTSSVGSSPVTFTAPVTPSAFYSNASYPLFPVSTSGLIGVPSSNVTGGLLVNNGNGITQFQVAYFNTSAQWQGIAATVPGTFTTANYFTIGFSYLA